MAEAQILIRELLEFAAELELAVIPINWLCTGTVDNSRLLLNALFGESTPVYFISRLKINPITNTLEISEMEHIQGVVFCHPYADWVITWNALNGGMLGSFYRLGSDVPPDPHGNPNVYFDRTKAVSPKMLLSTYDDFINAEPIKIFGCFSDNGSINIECPWRRSDAATLVDLAKLLSRHCDGIKVYEDMGIWPDKDFTKWVNRGNKWAFVPGATPVYPDPTDEL